MGVARAKTSDHKKGQNRKAYTKACDSQLLWRYLSMISCGVAFLGEDLTSWFSCCSCHGVAPVAGKKVMLGKHLDDTRERQMALRTSLERELLPMQKGALPREDLVTLLFEYDIAFDAFALCVGRISVVGSFRGQGSCLALDRCLGLKQPRRARQSRDGILESRSGWWLPPCAAGVGA